MSNQKYPTYVLGGSGYVAGELLRLLALHPSLELQGAVSESNAGNRIGDSFPHLELCYRDDYFISWEEFLDELPTVHGAVAIFAALPHGESAARLKQLLELTRETECRPRIVDLGADLRLGSEIAYEKIYGAKHTAPELFQSFICQPPELYRGETPEHVAHQGCFTTAVTLGCGPIHAMGLADGPFHVSAITGASGSGKSPKSGTHFPERHSNMYAYNALNHRHEAEMVDILERSSAGHVRPEVLFVPHSGSFSRGIHATIHVTLNEEIPAPQLLRRMKDFYAEAPFVTVLDRAPALKEVVGTNECRISASVRGRHAVILSVIDNLTKGASGGGVHWMNRLLGLDETTGLILPGLGWH